MKIAIDIRKIGKRSTGSEVYFYYLVKELAKLKESENHQFYLLTDEKAAEIKNILKPLPSHFSIHRVAPTAKLLWTFYSLPRFIKKNQIDLFHTEYIVPFYLSRKTKIVTTIHDISFKVNPNWIAQKDALVLNSFIPLSIKRADAIIAVSDFTKKEIVKYYKCPEAKIQVTYPAVDTRFFFSVEEKEAKKLAAEIVGGDFPFVLHISSLQPRKNVPLVISAFTKLKQEWRKQASRLKETKLVIVGEKNGYNYDEKIDEVLNPSPERDDIIMTGYQLASKLPHLYRAASAFVFPSSYEGFGIPILEAMASETPVVASNIGTFREVAGEAAILVDLKKKQTEEKLKEALKNLLENKKLREEKIKLGLERVKLFNWKKLAEKTLEIYESIG